MYCGMWALTDYCREEFGKFRIFLFQKGPKFNNFHVKFVNFPGETGRFECSYDRNSSAVFLLTLLSNNLESEMK